MTVSRGICFAAAVVAAAGVRRWKRKRRRWRSERERCGGLV